MEATYKPATESDIDNILGMMIEFYAIDGYPMDNRHSRKLFGEFIANENLGKAWLIEWENITIGYVILTYVFSFEYGGTIAFLDELYISEKARGKGIGKQTIGFIQSESRKSNVKLIYLEVETHNEKAQQDIYTYKVNYITEGISSIKIGSVVLIR